MSVGTVLKDVFNWLAEKPSSQYTLGGDKLSIKFNRAGRLVERVKTIPGVALGAAVALFGVPAALVGAVPVTASALAVGFGIAALSKAGGLVSGGIAHLVAKGGSSLMNHIMKPKAPANA